ncbi:hypothetical protein CEXT_3161 [Caerostris extrusa]|uniref:Uncharacterized protein n=1 Tax=Caerostris extrusa TaxID=172846 RepID=A0AAV4WLM0_CAEEX|nr:hypothetical protein CEXT_3161 [Caerostris extrusa]
MELQHVIAWRHFFVKVQKRQEGFQGSGERSDSDDPFSQLSGFNNSTYVRCMGTADEAMISFFGFAKFTSFFSCINNISICVVRGSSPNDAPYCFFFSLLSLWSEQTKRLDTADLNAAHK